MPNKRGGTVNVAIGLDTHRRLRLVAAQTDSKIKEIVENALKQWLEANEPKPKKTK